MLFATGFCGITGTFPMNDVSDNEGGALDHHHYDSGVEEGKHGETEPQHCNNTDTVNIVVASSTGGSGTATAAAGDSDMVNDHNGSDAGSSSDKSDTTSEATATRATSEAGTYSDTSVTTAITTVIATAGVTADSSISGTSTAASTVRENTTSSTANAAATTASNCIAAEADDILRLSITAQTTAANQLKKLIKLVLSTNESAEEKVESINYLMSTR
jgi:hypothetical protein